MLPGIIAATAIGGGIAGGAVSILFKGKKTGNAKRKKTKITYSTSVDTTIDAKPELPVEPVAPIPPVIAENAIESKPLVNDKQVWKEQNIKKLDQSGRRLSLYDALKKEIDEFININFK